VSFGLAVSEARPGGNVTGILASIPGLPAKRIEISLEAVPRATRIGLIINSSNPANRVVESEMIAAATKLRFPIVVGHVDTRSDLDGVLATLTREQIELVYVGQDPLLLSLRWQIADWASARRVAITAGYREHVDVGGLLSYGVSTVGGYDRAAYFVDRIFRGAEAGYLPFELPNTFEFVVNLKTARTLGIELPASIMIRATEVIE
jgi:putative tryptophan/tyrosine transport system substrate-binding protein